MEAGMALVLAQKKLEGRYHAVTFVPVARWLMRSTEWSSVVELVTSCDKRIAHGRLAEPGGRPARVSSSGSLYNLR